MIKAVVPGFDRGIRVRDIFWFLTRHRQACAAWDPRVTHKDAGVSRTRTTQVARYDRESVDTVAGMIQRPGDKG